MRTNCDTTLLDHMLGPCALMCMLAARVSLGAEATLATLPCRCDADMSLETDSRTTQLLEMQHVTKPAGMQNMVQCLAAEFMYTCHELCFACDRISVPAFNCHTLGLISQSYMMTACEATCQQHFAPSWG